MMTLSTRMAQKKFKGPGFDRIRLIAALVVVLHHCSTYVTNDIAKDVLFAYSQGFMQFGLLAVCVFFATSGFLVVPGLVRSGDVTTFAVNRCLRIMPALVVTVTASVLLVGPALTSLTPAAYFTDPETYRYFNNVLFRMVRSLPGVTYADGTPVIVNGALWTLYFEVLCYLTLALMFGLRFLSRRTLAAAFFAFVYVANAALWYSAGLAVIVPERLAIFLSLFVYFLAGVVIFLFADRIAWSRALAIVALAGLLLALPLGLGALVLPIAMPYLVVYLGFSDVFGRAPLKADYSYGVYLNHPVVLTALLVSAPSIDSFFIALPLLLAATAAIAFLSWTFIEGPSLRLKGVAREALRGWYAVLQQTRG